LGRRAEGSRRADGRIVYAIITRGWWGAALALGIVALLLYGVWRFVLAWGARPFPTAPDSDLPSVLKALFLQQAFTGFATDSQGLDAVRLHSRFGAFLAATQPTAATPALSPGEVVAPTVAWPE
jgi:hypothetical protein